MKRIKPEYTTKHLVQLGISREKLRDWINRGYVEPSIKGSGQGFKNIFDYVDLFYILVFNRMVDFGISRDETKERLINFREAFIKEKPEPARDPSNPFFMFFKNPQKPWLVEKDQFVDFEPLFWTTKRGAWFIVNGEQLKTFMEKMARAIDNLIVINFKNIREQIENLD